MLLRSSAMMGSHTPLRKSLRFQLAFQLGCQVLNTQKQANIMKKSLVMKGTHHLQSQTVWTNNFTNGLYLAVI